MAVGWKTLLEARVLEIIEIVLSGRKYEDDLVECKGQWPDPGNVHRQLAGHANAAGGEPVLWIIGLDESNHMLRELDGTDLAQWWPQVVARFADVAPDVRSLVVSVGDGRIVYALEFLTDRSPYVIKISGAAEREVPWREGTRTRSALRSELLRMLIPAVAVPEVEVVTAEVTANVLPAEKAGDPVNVGGDREECISLRAVGQVFFDVREPTMLPAHRWRLTVHLGGGENLPIEIPLRWFATSPRGDHSGRAEPSYPRGIDIRTSGLYINGPGAVNFGAPVQFPLDRRATFEQATTARLRLELPVSGGKRSARVEASLVAADLSRQAFARWVLADA